LLTCKTGSADVSVHNRLTNKLRQRFHMRRRGLRGARRCNFMRSFSPRCLSGPNVAISISHWISGPQLSFPCQRTPPSLNC